MNWWQFIAVGAFIFIVPATLAQSPLLITFTLAGIWGIAAVGVTLLASLGGQFTFGQAGLVSIGAYASAISTTEHGQPPVVGILIGMVLASTVALCTAPILRLRGWYLSLATLVVGYIFLELAVNLDWLTGGNDGIFGIQPLSLFGLELIDTVDYFVASWVLVIVFMVAARNLTKSRFGRAAAAIQADEEAAGSLGVPALRYKVLVWVLAALMASMAGSVYAHYSLFISPEDFSVHQSVTLFIAVLLGGYRSVFGGLVALVFLVSLPEIADGLAGTQLLTAIALMVVYAVSPNGLAGIGASGLRRQFRAGDSHA